MTHKITTAAHAADMMMAEDIAKLAVEASKELVGHVEDAMEGLAREAIEAGWKPTQLRRVNIQNRNRIELRAGDVVVGAVWVEWTETEARVMSDGAIRMPDDGSGEQCWKMR